MKNRCCLAGLIPPDGVCGGSVKAGMAEVWAHVQVGGPWPLATPISVIWVYIHRCLNTPFARQPFVFKRVLSEHVEETCGAGGN